MENLAERIEKKGVVCGIWSIIPNPVVVELAALSGFDFIIADMEHGSYGYTQVEDAIRAAELHRCVPLVRVAGINLNDTQRILDMGAHGIIVPQVSSAEETHKALSYIHFMPSGVRGFNPFTRGMGFGIRERGIAPLGSVIIENMEAWGEIDRILDIENLDMVYLGSYDMSVSMGCPGDMDNPNLLKFLEDGVKKIRKAGKIAGIMGQPGEKTKRFVDFGANLIVVGVDTFLIGKNFVDLQNRFREMW